MPYNLNGWIYLLYSIFWGMLSVLWVKTIYPYMYGLCMAELIMKLPQKFGRTATWMLLSFFIFDAAVYRTCPIPLDAKAGYARTGKCLMDTD